MILRLAAIALTALLGAAIGALAATSWMSAHIEWVDSDGDVFDEPFVAWGEDR